MGEAQRMPKVRWS